MSEATLPDVQESLEIDGLHGPFYASIHRYGVADRHEDDELSGMLATCKHVEDYGEGFVSEIGDAAGRIWWRDGLSPYKSESRAPGPHPYDAVEDDE